MYHTTGLTKAQIAELCTRIEERGIKPGMRPWPPILGLRNALTVTLTYLRRNRVQEEIAEHVTAYRRSAALSQRLRRSWCKCSLTTFLQQTTCTAACSSSWTERCSRCWSWGAHPDPQPGKHKTTGMKVLVACTLQGRLSWISDPVPGKRHDNYCLCESQVLEEAETLNWIGDKGFIGNGMITPFRKPAGGELLDWQKEFNTQVNKIRWVIEQVIANFKTWRIMHTDYRRPIETFTATISAVIGLHFYRMV